MTLSNDNINLNQYVANFIGFIRKEEKRRKKKNNMTLSELVVVGKGEKRSRFIKDKYLN